MRRQRRMKAEQIARMLWLGHILTRVAHMMGMSYNALLHTTKTPEFEEIDQEVRQDVLSKEDETRTAPR